MSPWILMMAIVVGKNSLLQREIQAVKRMALLILAPGVTVREQAKLVEIQG